MSTKEKFEREFEAFLSDQTRSSLETIYWKLPVQEPDTALDKAVLATARQALAATSKTDIVSLSTQRPRSIYGRHRWVMVFGSAAGVVLAAGVAWRVSVETWDKSTSLPLSAVSLPAPATLPPEEIVNIELKKTPLPAGEVSGEGIFKKQRDKEQTSQILAPTDKRPQNTQIQAPESKENNSIKNDEKHINREYISSTLSSEKNHSFSVPPTSIPKKTEKEGNTKADLRERMADEVAEPQAFPVQAASPSDEKNEPPREKDRFAEQTESAPSPSVPLTNPSPERQQDIGGKVKRSELNNSPIERSAGAAAPSPASPPTSVSASSSSISAKQTQKKENNSERQSSSRYPTKNDIQIKEPKPWIAYIRKLLRNHRTDEALDNLQAFRNCYPTYVLPHDLHNLVK